MPMIKNKPAAAPTTTDSASKPITTAEKSTTVDSGTKAAVSRLKKSTETAAAAKTDKKYSGRDYDAEARGKVACAAYAAALASDYLPGMPFKNLDEYLNACEKTADKMSEYVWRKQNESN